MKTTSHSAHTEYAQHAQLERNSRKLANAVSAFLIVFAVYLLFTQK